MEKSRNTGFCGGGEDEERQSINGSSNIDRYFQDPVPSIGVQNLLEINQIDIATEAESMRQPEPSQRQPADISTADSQPRRNFLQITEAEKLERKRSDLKYRNKVKENQKRLKSTAETLEAENERLKQENVLVKQQLEAKSKEFDLLKKNYDQQHENEQHMKSGMESLKADNENLKKKLDELRNSFYEFKLKKFEDEQRMKSSLETIKVENGLLNTKKKSLEDENFLLKHKFETKSEKLVEVGNDIDKLKQKYNKLLGKNHELESILEILEEENGLKAETIKSLNASLEEMSKHSGILDQLRSKLAKLELKRASVTSWINSSTNFFGGFGQRGHSGETEGSLRGSLWMEKVRRRSYSQPNPFFTVQEVQLHVTQDKKLGNSFKLLVKI